VLRTAGAAACVALLGALALSALCPAVSWAQASATTNLAADDDPNAGEVTDPSGIEALPLCAGCRLDPFNASRFIQAAGVERRRLLRDIEILARAHADGSMPDAATRGYLAGRLDDALELTRRGLSLSPASARGHMEAGMLRFGRFALTGLPPEASDDFDLMMQELRHVIVLQPWRAASHARIAELLTPLYAQCTAEHQAFIAQVTRRASAMQPWRDDLKRAAAGMVL
jgi:hypothetical protein